jgi:hypothetical protein
MTPKKFKAFAYAVTVAVVGMVIADKVKQTIQQLERK